MKIKSIKLYFHTLRFLKFSQIFWIFKYRFFKSKPSKLEDVAPRKWAYSWNAPLWQDNCWDGNKSFFFLEEKGSLSSQLDWSVRNKSILWIYNLHYLDCLNTNQQQDVHYQTMLVRNWIKANRDTKSIGWDPYCLSLRIINLIKWCSRNNIYSNDIIKSIGFQAEILMTKIEYHLLANHLFANGKALIFAGAFLQGEMGLKLLKKGLQIIDNEIDEQFLSDGGHFELSPMYHQILTWDVCDLVLIAKISDLDMLKLRLKTWQKVIYRAEIWRAAMEHPDNEVAFFNDTAIGIAPDSCAIKKYLKLLGITTHDNNQHILKDLRASGFYSISQSEGHKLIINACEISPYYQPGHSHADSLSFELSISKNRLFVNSGISVYGDSDLRLLQRSTQSKNTVSLDFINSSQIWSGFRVAKRARIVLRNSIKKQDSIVIEAAHDGYKQQAIGEIHYRKWISKSDSLIIEDQLISKNHNAVAHFLLHPDVLITDIYDNKAVLKLHEKKIVFKISSGKLSILTSKWYPKFGTSINTNSIQVTDFFGSLISHICWKNNE